MRIQSLSGHVHLGIEEVSPASDGEAAGFSTMGKLSDLENQAS